MDQIAANAKMARIRAGYATHEAAAKAIGCSRTLVLAWENQRRPAPIKGSQYLLDAARAYRVRPEWLADGDGPDGFPWQEGARGEVRAFTSDATSELARGLEALARSQAYMAQALAATIPTAAREILSAIDNRMPQELREVGYMQALRVAIVAQLASNDMAAMPVPPRKVGPEPHRKRQ